MMQGIDNTFSAAVFIGYHASQGQANAVLAHSFSGRMAVRLNGTVVPEAGFNAAIAGEFGVPVVFVSGDQAISEEAKRLLGPIETASVKQAIGFHSAIMMHPEEAQRLIRAGVQRAIAHRSQTRLYRPTHPIKVEIQFQDVVNAEVLSYLPGVERPSGDTIIFVAHDMVEASKFLEVVHFVRP